MINNRQLPPSTRGAKQAEDLKQAKDFDQKKQDLMREDFAKTYNTPHGMRVLAWIMERSGFGKVILSAESGGKLDPYATMYSAMELNHYLAIRRHVPTDVLARIEYGDIKPTGFFDPEEEPKRTTSKSKSKHKGA